MNLLSYFIIFVLFVTITNNCVITKFYEHFMSLEIKQINYNNDLFQTIFNCYNPYLVIYNKPIDLIKSKCYYGQIINNDIILFINNVFKKINTKYTFTLETNILFIQRSYIIGIINDIYKLTKKTNYLYHYYNKIINIQNIMLLIGKYMTTFDYNYINWIQLCYKIVIDNNLINMTNKNDYNKVLIISDYILNEMKKYAYSLFNKSLDVNVMSSIYLIKNGIFYGDDGNYFIENNIFDCKNI
jgi:hypothetical protein